MADAKKTTNGPAKSAPAKAAKAAPAPATTEDKAAAAAATEPGEPGDDLNKAVNLDKGDIEAVQAALEDAQPEGSQGPTPAQERAAALADAEGRRDKGAPPIVPPFLSEGVRQELETFGEAVDPGSGGLFKVDDGKLIFTPRRGDPVEVNLRAHRR